MSVFSFFFGDDVVVIADGGDTRNVDRVKQELAASRTFRSDGLCTSIRTEVTPGTTFPYNNICRGFSFLFYNNNNRVYQ
jgi:hypothetical protein